MHSNGYATYVSGTSFAAANVTGVVSIMQNFKTIEREDIEGILKISVDDKGASGWDSLYGHGRLNAEKAINYLRGPYVLSKYPTPGNTISGGDLGDPNYTYLNAVIVSGSPNDGERWLRLSEVHKTINYSLPAGHSLISVWGRGAGDASSGPITGWDNDFSAYYISQRHYTPTPFCEVVPGSLTSTSFTLRTYIYHFYNGNPFFGGELIGIYPSTVSNVTNWKYTLLTKNNRMKFYTQSDYMGNKTLTFNKDTVFVADDEVSDFYVRDSTKIVMADSSILELPDNYTLHFVGKTTSLKLSPHSKIRLGENSKIVFDSSAKLIMNYATLTSKDSTKSWGGLFFKNTSQDTISNSKIINSKGGINFIDKIGTHTVIKDNEFINKTNEDLDGIYAYNSEKILIRGNHFYAQSTGI